MLRGSDTYVSGQEMCEHFGVSRTAIWKAIHSLQQEGYVIEAVPKKGYHMVAVPDILSEKEIATRLTTKWVGRKIVYYAQTGSTNVDARRFAEEGAPSGTLVVADEQTQGRGRRGRVWQSPLGGTISMSLMLKPDFAPEYASQLTLVMALSVTKALKALTGREGFGIKWPNDVVLSGKKVVGILTEMSAEADYIHNVVIGVGINVNQSEFDEEIADKATSLYVEFGEKFQRAELIAKIMYFFEQDYEVFAKTNDLSGLREDYEKTLLNKNQAVRVLDPKGEFEGTALGINERGELLVQRAGGEVESIYAGEVSVRGLYSYT